MGKCTLFLHHISYIIGITFTIAAVALTITSLTTERWLIAEHKLTRDSMELHQHGLWKNCIDYYQISQASVLPIFQESLCTLKERQRVPADDLLDLNWSRSGLGRSRTGSALIPGITGARGIDHNQAHMLRNWNIVMLVLLVFAGLSGILAVIVGFSASISFCKPNACCGKCCSVFWSFMLLLSVLTSLAAVIFFTYKSYQSDVRSERLTAVNSRIDQTPGSSYYQSIVAAILYVISLIFAVIATILSFVIGHHRHAHHSKAHHEAHHYMANTRV